MNGASADYCPKCVGLCRPTRMQPVVKVKGKEPTSIAPGDKLRVSHVHPNGTVLLTLKGRRNGRAVRCKPIAKAHANFIGHATVTVPAKVEGKVNISCRECGIVSDPFPVMAR